jgi:hypothetical protein
MARAWLDHLPSNSINCWEDIKEIFIGNFQGTYVWSGNPWDLIGCRQKQEEFLQDYIWLSPESATRTPRSMTPMSSQHSSLA